MSASRWLCGIFGLVATAASAGPLTVQGSDTDGLALSNALTSQLLMLGRNPLPCCLIGSDAITRDVANDRLWVATREAGAPALRRFDVNGNSVELTLDASTFAVGLGFDGIRGELAALVRSSINQALHVRRYNAVTGALLGEIDVPAACCALRPGTVVWSTARRAFLAIGTSSSAPTTLRLWQIDAVSPSALGADLNPTNLSVQTLTVDPDDDAPYALVHDAVNTRTQLATIAASGLITVKPAFETDCCFVLASRATIEPGVQTLYAVTRGFDETGFSLRSFALSTGTVGLAALSPVSAGLVSDPNVPVTAGVLFADGFESGP